MMILYIYIDGSCLSINKAQNRVGGYFFFTDNPKNSELAKHNGAINVLCNIIKNIMGSDSEKEIASIFEH